MNGDNLTIDDLVEKLKALRRVYCYLTEAADRHDIYLYRAYYEVELEGKRVRDRIADRLAADGLAAIDERLADSDVAS